MIGTNAKRDERGRLRSLLEELYARYTSRDLVHPDPLELVLGYRGVRDREIAGMVASCLAYGRVKQILVSVSRVLEPMGGSPRAFLESTSRAELDRMLEGFRHRFTTGAQLADLLWSVRQAVRAHGSLEQLFVSHLDSRQSTVIQAQKGFCRELGRGAQTSLSFLLPSPEGGSACKRLNLYLRWMVRRDEVDPGGWNGVPAEKLVVPLDTHMFAVGRALGFTRRKAPDLRSALEITEGFRTLAPEDPIKYDFALTRPGIWGEGSRLSRELKERLH